MTGQSPTCVADYRYVKTIGNAAAPGQIGFRNPGDVRVCEGGAVRLEPCRPNAVEIDEAGRIIVVDSARHRLQIYEKVAG